MSVIKKVQALGFHWKTYDPFLFCAHHLDKYPEGRDNLGPNMPLSRRSLGQDFDLSNDWKMYHGHEVPGFPEHPHRGFETVTIVLEGYVDHFDSGGASGRYGQGDVQWMTAGAGMQHAEMFPLLHSDKPNPLHLFQIWLNLPRENKFVEPHYKMLWGEDIPKVKVLEGDQAQGQVTVIAGEYGGVRAVAPAPDSWAADPENKVDILLVHVLEGGKVALPSRTDKGSRTLYFYKGKEVRLNGETVAVNNQVSISGESLVIEGVGAEAYLLLLQAEPIDEPVAQYGPFVMNTMDEIRQAYADYQETRFGGWPWDRSDPTHDKGQGRIARYANGRVETP